MLSSGVADDVRVGIVGTGFIARGLAHSINRSTSLHLACVLTRRDPESASGPWQGKITNSPEEILRRSDIVVITTGDPIYGTEIAAGVLAAKIPVITMDAELQVTTGSFLARKGVIVEAQGDQPGSLALLAHEAREMGLNPIVYGNIKGFLNPNPSHSDMIFWADKNGISLPQVTAFTDGTKLQIEQALVANGLGATIANRGLIGPRVDSVQAGALELAQIADKRGVALSDYVLPKKGNPGVFVVVTFEEEFGEFFRYYKVRLGESPYVLLERPFHLCNFEIPVTIARLLRGDLVEFNNGLCPRISVAAIAKHALRAGERIERAIGGFQVRGEAVVITDEPEHVPIGLLAGAMIEKPIGAGDIVTRNRVSLPDSLALNAWQSIIADLTTTQ